MSPLLLLTGSALGLFFLFGKKHPAPPSRTPNRIGVKQPTSAQLAAIVTAVASGDPERMRDLADSLDGQGLHEQADQLRQAARDAEKAPINVPRPPAGSTPVIDVPTPPVGSKPLPRPEQPKPTPPVIDVPTPPVGSTPVTPDRRIPATVDQLTADYATMIQSSAPEGPVKNLKLSKAFKSATGTRGDAKFYGQGPALALIKRGVVPPTPWDWQRADPEKDKASYRRQLVQARKDDPDRADLWTKALEDV